MPSTLTPPRPSPAERPVRHRYRRRPPLVGAAFAAVWLVPIGAHVVHADALVWPLLLVTTAAVLRGGDTLLERLMLAGFLDLGAILALGLVFSLWPWHLQPVPVGGVLLSGAVLGGALTGRRPALPRRVVPADLVVLATGVVAAIGAYYPLLVRPLNDRLQFTMLSADRANHFALYSTIERLGGYAFLHHHRAAATIARPTGDVYPQGSHFLIALLRNFVTSGARPASGVRAYDSYSLYATGTYVLVCVAIVWATCRVAGECASELRRAVSATAVACLVLFGPLSYLVILTYESQACGLLFVAAAAAIAARPLRDLHEHLLLAGAITVGAFYCYNIFGPVVVVMLSLSMITKRLPLRRLPAFAPVVVVGALMIAAVPTAVSLRSGFDAQQQAVTGGRGLPVGLLASALVGAVAGVAAMTRGARRDQAWRGTATVLVTAFGAAVLFGAYQVIASGTVSYYFYKFVLAAYVCGLVCFGALAAGSATASARRVPARRRPALRLAASALATVLVAALAVGQQALTVATDSHVSARQPAVPLVSWARGDLRHAFAPLWPRLAADGYLSSPQPTLFMISYVNVENWYPSYFAASLNHLQGRMAASLHRMRDTAGTPGSSRLQYRVQVFTAAVAAAPPNVRVVTGDRVFAAALRIALARRGLSAQVVLAPGLSAPQRVGNAVYGPFLPPAS